MEFLDIVNEKDEVVGNASKNEIYEKLLQHRIVHILVFNDKGEIALQLRGREVSFCPLHWCSAAAGHVKSGESYEEAALRELEEEIGIKAPVEFLYKDLYENSGKPTKFIATFKTTHGGPFSLGEREVEAIEFFSLDEIKIIIKNGEKIHPELLFLLKKHFNFE